MPLPQILTTPEVATLIGRSPRTVHRLVHDKKIEAVKQMSGPNGALLFSGTEVERYLATLTSTTSTEQVPVAS